MRQSGKHIPIVSTTLNLSDRAGSWKARWGIGRMHHTISPGLYGIGKPDDESPVLVTANYKMTFDRVRTACQGMDVWLLVLDTKGINVWCTAGKGTFGNEEVIRRIGETGPDKIVSHKTLILPQLDAPGVAAHLVKSETGFKVTYGPIEIHDLERYLKNGRKTNIRMRRISFPVRKRIVLIPMELVPAIKLMPVFVIILGLFHLFKTGGFHTPYLNDLVLLVVAVLTGSVLFQLLLPVIPFRSFALKGWILGIVTMILIGSNILDYGGWALLSGLLLMPPVASFLALNITGSTPFTSLSGVTKEISVAVPAYLISLTGGLIIKSIV